MPVEALLLPLRMPLFCSFEIIALVGCVIVQTPYLTGVLVVKFFLFLGERKEAAALGADLPQIVVQGGL